MKGAINILREIYDNSATIEVVYNHFEHDTETIVICFRIKDKELALNLIRDLNMVTPEDGLVLEIKKDEIGGYQMKFRDNINPHDYITIPFNFIKIEWIERIIGTFKKFPPFVGVSHGGKIIDRSPVVLTKFQHVGL